MKCPQCGHQHSRVIDTKRHVDSFRRHRMCAKCHHRFATTERIEVWDPAVGSYLAAVPTPDAGDSGSPLLPEMLSTSRSSREVKVRSRFAPAADDEALQDVTPEARPLLLQWWNESRWSKHKGKATWTEAAWVGSIRRVALLSAEQQLDIARSGVESGWQALKWEFMGRQQQGHPLVRTDGRLMPQDPRMLEAIRLEREANDGWLSAS